MTDATSLYHRVGFHASKDGAYVHLQNLVHYVKVNTGVNVKVIHVDGGRKYGGRELNDLCQSNGIDLRVTTPHNSKLNGRVETSNLFICTVARNMMIHGNIPKGLWTEAIEATIYIINIMPSATLQNTSPYQTVAQHLNWEPKVPYIGNIRVYGCKVFVLGHEVERSNKFAARALFGKFVGSEAHNLYLLWIPTKHKVIRTTNASFDEECLDLNNKTDENSNKIKLVTNENERSVIGNQVFSSVNEPTNSSDNYEPENSLVDTSESDIEKPEGLSVDASGVI